MSKQADAAKARIEGDENFAKGLTDHFNAQADLFAFCHICTKKIMGTMQQIKEHRCESGN